LRFLREHGVDVGRVELSIRADDVEDHLSRLSRVEPAEVAEHRVELRAGQLDVHPPADVGVCAACRE